MTVIISAEQASANYYCTVENMPNRYFTSSFVDALLSKEDAHTCRMLLGSKYLSPVTATPSQLKDAILKTLAQIHVTLVA